MRVENHLELGATLRKALAAERPAIIEIPVSQLEEPWEVLGEA